MCQQVCELAIDASSLCACALLVNAVIAIRQLPCEIFLFLFSLYSPFIGEDEDVIAVLPAHGLVCIGRCDLTNRKV